jgi:hypothetical protein
MTDTPEPLTVEQSRPNLGFAVLAVVKYQRRCGMLRVEPDLSHEVYAAYEKALDTLIAAARREGAQQALEDVAHEITLGIQGERHQRTGLNPPFHKDRYFLEGMRAAREIVTDVIHRRASLPLETPNP